MSIQFRAREGQESGHNNGGCAGAVRRQSLQLWPEASHNFLHTCLCQPGSSTSNKTINSAKTQHNDIIGPNLRICSQYNQCLNIAQKTLEASVAVPAPYVSSTVVSQYSPILQIINIKHFLAILHYRTVCHRIDNE